MTARPLSVLILAAGKVTRMKSGRAKVLHDLLGRPMLAYVTDLARDLATGRAAVVVGYRGDEVASVVPGGDFEIIVQAKQLGTGHAVRQARRLLEEGGDLLVLSGDTPLLRSATLRRLLAGHRRSGSALTVLTADLPDPTGYGRIIRGGRGKVAAIVEQTDATPAERLVREINTGVYCFDSAFLDKALRRLRRNNRQGEFYLTDVVAMAVGDGLDVAAVRCADPGEVIGVNSRLDLSRAQGILRGRKLEALMRSGVTIADPASTWVGTDVRVGRDTVLLPQTFLEGKTRIGRDCRIGPMARIRHSTVGRGTVVKDSCVIESARIGSACQVGPFAHLRPGSRLGDGAKVGNFVELKASRLGKGAKVNHLSYVGDSEVGRDVNVGAGTITCNYDGVRKWRTVIGDGAFIGSGTQLVAPVRVGRGALVGAGSTITRDVPPGALALTRPPQENRKGVAKRYLKKKK